jgi:hypothetical protein
LTQKHQKLYTTDLSGWRQKSGWLTPDLSQIWPNFFEKFAKFLVKITKEIVIF